MPLLRFPLLGCWPKVNHNRFYFSMCTIIYYHAEDHSFKDKDVETAKAIFKEQEEKPNHVEYEFRIWKGKTFFLVTGPCLIQSVDASN